MSYVNLKIEFKDRTVLVVGGGDVGLRKASKFIEKGANVKIVSPVFKKKLDGANCIEREFKKEDLEDVFLVIICTNNKELNASISKMAKDMGILSNVCDDKDGGDVRLTREFEEGGVEITISTTHGTPFIIPQIEKKIRKSLEEFTEERLKLMSIIREMMIEKNYSNEKKKEVYEIMTNMDVEELLELKTLI